MSSIKYGFVYVITVTTLMIVFVTWVEWSGDSFGARCDRMHPNDPIASERCVFDIAKWLRP